MIEQILDSFRKAAESSLQTQQDMFKQWNPQWTAANLHIPGSSEDLREALRKRLQATFTSALAREKARVDAVYEALIELTEHSFQLLQAKSPEDVRRIVEEMWRKLWTRAKQQSDDQLRDLQTASATWLELVANPAAAASAS